MGKKKVIEEEKTYSPKLIEFEKELVFTKDPFLNQIRALFFTRKNLTQRELQRLTKLSTGKISQVLKTLRRWKLIERSSVSNTGEYTYSMDSVERSCRNYFHLIVEELSQNLEPLEEIQEILEQKGETIKSLKGYDELSYLIPLFLKAIKINIEIMEDFKDVDIGEKK